MFGWQKAVNSTEPIKLVGLYDENGKEMTLTVSSWRRVSDETLAWVNDQLKGGRVAQSLFSELSRRVCEVEDKRRKAAAEAMARVDAEMAALRAEIADMTRDLEAAREAADESGKAAVALNAEAEELTGCCECLLEQLEAEEERSGCLESVIAAMLDSVGGAEAGKKKKGKRGKEG